MTCDMTKADGTDCPNEAAGVVPDLWFAMCRECADEYGVGLKPMGAYVAHIRRVTPPRWSGFKNEQQVAPSWRVRI